MEAEGAAVMIRPLYVAAPKDLALRTELDKHLTVLQRRGLLAPASDVLGGDVVEDSFRVALEDADLVLLLLSADFTADAEVWERRLPAVLARHEQGLAEVVPVLARPMSDLRGTPLGELAPLPTDGLAVVRGQPREERWVAVVEGIRKVAERVRFRKAARGWPVPLGCVLLSFGDTDRRWAQTLFDRLYEHQVRVFLHDRDRAGRAKDGHEQADPALDAADTAQLLVLIGDEDHEIWKRPELARTRNRLGLDRVMILAPSGEVASLEDQIRRRWLAIGDELASVLPSKAPLDRSPFRPLQPFASEDRDLFFGRDVAAADLAELVRAERLVVLHGASGTGKTSLLQAGLRPILEPDFLWLQCSPGSDLDGSVRSAVAEEQGAPVTGPPSVMVRALARSAGRKVLLVVDQAEELFIGRSHAELLPLAKRATDLLWSCTQAGDVDLRVLLCLRNDYLGYLHLLKTAGLPLIFTHEQLLLPLDAGASRAAIMQPLSRLGLALPRALAQRLVADLSDEGQQVSPVELQLVCENLLQEARRAGQDIISENLYRNLGGAGKVLATYLHRVQGELSERERRAVQALLRALLHADGTRRPAQEAVELTARAGLTAGAAGELIEKLVQQRLLRSAGGEAGPAVYRIAHDLLARELYEQLSEEEKRDLALGERLRQLARTWAEGGRGRLLSYMPPSLRVDLFGWRERHPREMTGEEQAFLRTLRRYHAMARRARVIGPVAAGLLVAGTLWTAYDNYRGRVEEQAKSAEIQAEAALEKDPGQAMAWIAEAARLRGGWEGEPEASYHYHWLMAREAWEKGLGWVIAEYRQSVTTLAYSSPEPPGTSCSMCWPHRKLLASASAGGQVSLFDLELGGRAQALPGEHAGMAQVIFSRDGRWVISGGLDGMVQVWDVATRRPIKVLQETDFGVVQLALSPDGRWLAAEGPGSTLIWDTRTWKRRKIDGPHRTPRDMAFSPRDPDLLASIGTTGEPALLIRAESGDRRPLPGSFEALLALDFSPDGTWLAVAGLSRDQPNVALFQHPFRAPAATFDNLGGSVNSVAIFAAGHKLVFGDAAGQVMMWDARSDWSSLLAHHDGGVRKVVLSPDNRWVASSGFDDALRVTHADGYSWQRVYRGHQGGATTAVAFSPDGQLLASGGIEGQVRLWHMISGRTSFHGAGQQVVHVTQGPKQMLVAERIDDQIVLWRTPGHPEPDHVWKVKLGDWRVCFLGDDRLVAAGTDGLYFFRLSDGDMRANREVDYPSIGCPPNEEGTFLFSRLGRSWQWRADGLSPVEVGNHENLGLGLIISPDGRRLASGSLDGTIRLWSLDQHSPSITHDLKKQLLSLAWLDLDQVVFGGQDGQVHGWNSRTGAQAALGVSHRSPIVALAVSRDGQLLASVSPDELRLSWVRSGIRRGLRGHKGPVRSVDFARDGRTLASGGFDGTVRLWSIPPTDRVAFQRWLQAHSPFEIRNSQPVAKLMPPITEAFTDLRR